MRRYIINFIVFCIAITSLFIFGIAVADSSYPTATIGAITQSETGDGSIKIGFHLYDETIGIHMTLKQFEFSVDGGATWAAPRNGDASTSLSGHFNTNLNQLISQSPTDELWYFFIVNTKNVDVGLYGTDQSDIRIRFKVNNGTVDSNFIESNNFRVDDLGPGQAIISNLPANPTTSRTTDIIVSGTDVVYYNYRFFIGSNPFNEWRMSGVPVETNLQLSNIPEGRHTLHVTGVDFYGNPAAAAPTEYRWLVDYSGPQITTSGTVVPSSASNDTTPELTLGISDAGIGASNANVRFSCDNATWTNFELFQTTKNNFNVNSGMYGCSSSDGEKYIYVQAQDSLGNIGTNSRIGPFIINTLLPRTPTLSNLPTNPTRIKNASITVSGDSISHYKYKLDLNEYSAEIPVALPIVLSNLSNGRHTLEVSGRDSAGNYAALPATYTWAVADGIYPSAGIFGISQSTATTGIGVITVNFQLYDETVGVPMTLKQFEYSVDNGTTWAAPQNGDASTSLSDVWRIRPSLLTSQSPSSDARYSFTWNTRHVDLSGLAGADQNDVKIRFKVNNGTIDSNFIESSNFRVDSLPPGDATLSNLPANPTSSRTTDIIVSGTDIASYDYRLYISNNIMNVRRLSGSPVNTHLQLSDLPEGQHILSVIGFDAFGSASRTVEYRWTVNFSVVSPPPATTVTAVLNNTPPSTTGSSSVDITVGGTGVEFYRYVVVRTAAEVAALTLSNFGAETPVSTHIVLSGLENGNYFLVVLGRSATGTYPDVSAATVTSWTVNLSTGTGTGTNPPAGETPPAGNPGGGNTGSGNTGTFNPGGGGGGGGIIYPLKTVRVLGVKKSLFPNGTILKLKGFKKYFIIKQNKRSPLNYYVFLKKYSKSKVKVIVLDKKTLEQIPLLKVTKAKKIKKSVISVSPTVPTVVKTAPTKTFIEVAFARVRIRSGIGYSAAILGMSTKGQKFEVLEEKQAWYKIKYKSASAWIEGKWVRKK